MKGGNKSIRRLISPENIDWADNMETTPLHDHGANVHLREQNGFTPLHIAASANDWDIVSMFLDWGAESDKNSPQYFSINSVPLIVKHSRNYGDLNIALIPRLIPDDPVSVLVAITMTFLAKNGIKEVDVPAGFTTLESISAIFANTLHYNIHRIMSISLVPKKLYQGRFCI